MGLLSGRSWWIGGQARWVPGLALAEILASSFLRNAAVRYIDSSRLLELSVFALAGRLAMSIVGESP
jgi:hypothetical protein